ncbi:MAG: hypothetical protein IVW57_11230 [Ktedonobacterales bacterium]|nr:hypothetical protein [Ktedonobacterales bacterium]
MSHDSRPTSCAIRGTPRYAAALADEAARLFSAPSGATPSGATPSGATPSGATPLGATPLGVSDQRDPPALSPGTRAVLAAIFAAPSTPVVWQRETPRVRVAEAVGGYLAGEGGLSRLARERGLSLGELASCVHLTVEVLRGLDATAVSLDQPHPTLVEDLACALGVRRSAVVAALTGV